MPSFVDSECIQATVGVVCFYIIVRLYFKTVKRAMKEALNNAKWSLHMGQTRQKVKKPKKRFFLLLNLSLFS